MILDILMAGFEDSIYCGVQVGCRGYVGMSFEVRRLMREMHRVHVEMASRIDGVRVLLLGL
jgi:hypothetical protein